MSAGDNYGVVIIFSRLCALRVSTLVPFIGVSSGSRNSSSHCTVGVSSGASDYMGYDDSYLGPPQ